MVCLDCEEVVSQYVCADCHGDGIARIREQNQNFLPKIKSDLKAAEAELDLLKNRIFDVPEMVFIDHLPSNEEQSPPSLLQAASLG